MFEKNLNWKFQINFKFILLVALLIFTFCTVFCTKSYGHYSIIPEQGWKVGPPIKMKYHEREKLSNIAISEHFKIETNLPQEAAEQIVRHLEVWHQQIYKLLPNCAEIEKTKGGKWGFMIKGKWNPIKMNVFAYPEEKAAFYNLEKVGNTTGGIICLANKDNPGYQTLSVTALQHEIFHYWDNFYYDRHISSSISERGADYFGRWDIDKTVEENLHGKMNDPAWKFAYDTRFGKANQRSRWHWMNAEEFFTNQNPPGCAIYQQGELFYRFLMADEKGRWYSKIIFFAHQKNPAAWEWMKTSADNKYIKEKYRDLNVPFKRLTGTTWDTPFTDEFLEMFDEDWSEYLEKEHERLYGKQVDNILNFKKFDLFLQNAIIQTMSLNSKAFSNRTFKWISVPPFLEGMKYTQTAGNVFAEIELAAKENIVIYAAGELPEKSNWVPVRGVLRYDDRGKIKNMKLYKTEVKAGQSLIIPQKGWSGTIMFFKD